MKIQQALQKLLDRQDLASAEMAAVIRQIMTGAATDAQIGGFLVALRCKGETVDEIAAAAQVIRDLAGKVPVIGEHIIDTCGTGGDGANTFNISTTSAFVVAAAGAKVPKHGNRSVSSRCGSADVLEAAGINIEMSGEDVARCVDEVGIGFLFAPKHHGAIRYTIGPRREMGIRTLFNLLGPMANPAAAPNQLIGVFSRHWIEPMAEVLKKLGSRHVLVVSADDGLDEISIGAPTQVAELKDGGVITYTLTPEQFGLRRASLSELAISDVASSLAHMRAVLDNLPGPARDIVLLNAGAAIYAADLVQTLPEGIAKADAMLASGAARAKLEALIAYSKSH